MSWKSVISAAALAVAVTLPIKLVWARAPVSIVRIGEAVTGVSADGSVVAGFSTFGANLELTRWTAESGLVPLGIGVGFDVSRDGSAVVGSRFNGTTTRAVRWTAGTGVVELGQLPGAGPAAYSEAFDVSADGSVIIGIADTNAQFGQPFLGFRWTSATGMLPLTDLVGGATIAQASAISADGQVTVGFGTGANGARAVRWLGGSLTPISMGLPPGLAGFTEAKHVSGDGQVVVGVWGDGLSMNEAFRWTQAGGYELLGDLPGGILDSVATATNGDGSVIVGTGNPGDTLPDEPFYWTRSRGMLSFRDVLTNAGIDSSQWARFTELRDLSDDGLVIVGNGVLLDGSLAGFRVVLPAPGAAASLALGALVAGRRRR